MRFDCVYINLVCHSNPILPSLFIQNLPSGRLLLSPVPFNRKLNYITLIRTQIYADFQRLRRERSVENNFISLFLYPDDLRSSVSKQHK